MKNRFLAKSHPEETINEHTANLIENFNTIRKIYPNIENVNWMLLEYACIYHDLGKMNTKFQNKIMNNMGINDRLSDDLDYIKELPHGYLSPAFLPFKKLKTFYDNDNIRILCQSIFYHHNREKIDNFDDIKTTLKEDVAKYLKDFNFEEIGIDSPDKLTGIYDRYIFKRIPNEDDSDETTKKFITIKGLLNKIDYAASSGTTVEFENYDLFDKTNIFLKDGGFAPNELQQYMIDNSNNNVVAIASTGIGKTEGALFWIGNNKGFFTLPLRVSINAIYDRIVEKIRFKQENTGLLHSETATEYMRRSEGVLDKNHLDSTKQLSLPLTICTLDQLVDFIFKYEGYELKLATLSYSKLVIDEIQMYSPEMVGYLIVALKQITDMGGKFAILTATLPPIVEYLLKYKKIVYEKSDKPFLKKKDGEVILRHRVDVIESKIDIQHIKDNYKDKKVLVIVNTVKEAQRIYKVLKVLKDVEVNIFHSKFIKVDRAERERQILAMGELENTSKGIWITTQVVEASLDIDFDVLYTELSDISGLLQRMGRVYRNRELLGQETNIFVYTGGDGYPSGIRNSDKSVIDIDIFKVSKIAINGWKNKELNEEDKMKLVEVVYSLDNLSKSNYFKKIKLTIDTFQHLKAFEYKKSEINLRNIDTRTVIPKSIYIKNKSDIKMWLEVVESNNESYNQRLKAKDNIMNFTVTIPEYEYQFANRKGLISNSINIGKFNEIGIINFPYDTEGLMKPINIDHFDEEEQFT